MFGQWAVSLASVFVCGGGSSGSKKHEFRVSFADISKTYHLLHQLSMACKYVCVCVCVCACDMIFNGLLHSPQLPTVAILVR